ncbi:MAG TPA: AAA family ATPase [Lacipirellulaceae bacterium]
MATRRAGAFRLTDVTPTGIQWLWPGRIPFGYVTLLVSDPGAGKSLVALDVAARVSTGRSWPDQASDLNPEPQTLNPSSVLVLNIEDHFASTVRPRLDALGADCSRIIGMSHVPGEGVFHLPQPVAINRDINRIEAMLREIPNCRLMILDPITAFFGDTSNRSTGNIWKVLLNLSWLAASANLAVLAVSHVRKKEGAAIHSALGSLAFMAAARTAWTIAPDPDDAGRRLFLPLKNNLAESAGGLAFTIESTPSGGSPIVRWLPDRVESKADLTLAPGRKLGRPNDELERAVAWLTQYLAQGSTPTNDVRRAADANGIAYRTLRRAFCEIGAQAVQRGLGHNRRWYWELPAQMSKNHSEEIWTSEPKSARRDLDI